MEEQNENNPETKQPSGPDAQDYTEVGAGKKVLLVDDDPVSLAFTEDVLKKTGFEISVAKGGQEALKLVKEKCPSLMIIDVVMPEMGGFELYKELMTHDETKHIKVIILTARKKMEESFAAVGADAFLAKPVTAQDLLETVIQLSLRLEEPRPKKEESKNEDDKKESKEESKEESKKETKKEAKKETKK